MDAPDAPDVRGVRLLRAVTRAARAVSARIEPTLRAEGLTVDQWLVIDALAGAGGAAMADLAASTLVTGPTLTRVVDRLVLTALAFREVDAADRRRVRVYLSPRGRAAHRRIGGRLAELERTLLAGIDPPEPVLDALDRLSD